MSSAGACKPTATAATNRAPRDANRCMRPSTYGPAATRSRSVPAVPFAIVDAPADTSSSSDGLRPPPVLALPSTASGPISLGQSAGGAPSDRLLAKYRENQSGPGKASSDRVHGPSIHLTKEENMQVLLQQLNIAMVAQDPQLVNQAWEAIDAARAETASMKTQAAAAITGLQHQLGTREQQLRQAQETLQYANAQLGTKDGQIQQAQQVLQQKDAQLAHVSQYAQHMEQHAQSLHSQNQSLQSQNQSLSSIHNPFGETTNSDAGMSTPRTIVDYPDRSANKQNATASPTTGRVPNPEGSSFCPECGNACRPNTKFCRGCGCNLQDGATNSSSPGAQDKFDGFTDRQQTEECHSAPRDAPSDRKPDSEATRVKFAPSSESSARIDTPKHNFPSGMFHDAEYGDEQNSDDDDTSSCISYTKEFPGTRKSSLRKDACDTVAGQFGPTPAGPKPMDFSWRVPDESTVIDKKALLKWECTKIPSSPMQKLDFDVTMSTTLASVDLTTQNYVLNWYMMTTEVVGDAYDVISQFHNDSQGLDWLDKYVGSKLVKSENLANPLFGAKFKTYVRWCQRGRTFPRGRVFLAMISLRFRLDRSRGKALNFKHLLDIELKSHRLGDVRKFVEQVNSIFGAISEDEIKDKELMFTWLWEKFKNWHPIAIKAAQIRDARDGSRKRTTNNKQQTNNKQATNKQHTNNTQTTHKQHTTNKQQTNNKQTTNKQQTNNKQTTNKQHTTNNKQQTNRAGQG